MGGENIFYIYVYRIFVIILDEKISGVFFSFNPSGD
jgi:hypothetical protein